MKDMKQLLREHRDINSRLQELQRAEREVRDQLLAFSPVNEAAKTLAEIAGTSTLTPITCVRAIRLGAEFRFSAARHYDIFNELLGDGRVVRHV